MGRSYQDLEVWQKAIDLVICCYKILQRFPKNEEYGLTSQIKRSVVSIPSNIAEGQQRQHRKVFLQFLSIAQGSLAEFETHLIIAGKLGFIDDLQERELLARASGIGKMINGLKKSLVK